MTEKQQAECTIESDGTGVFVVFEGVRIAKRGEARHATGRDVGVLGTLLRSGRRHFRARPSGRDPQGRLNRSGPVPPLRQPHVGSPFFFRRFAAMPARKIRIGCLLAGVFVLSILDYGDAALARPAHQVSREGKSQSQSKSEKVEGVRPRASGRGTDAATSDDPHHSSRVQVEPAAIIVRCDY